MAESALEGVTGVMAREAWTIDDYRELIQELSSGKETLRTMAATLSEMEQRSGGAPKGAAALKTGIIGYLLCRFNAALMVLADATDNKERRYFQAQCWKNLNQYEKAAEELDRAKAKGWDADEVDLEMIELRALAGKLEDATTGLAKLAKKLGETAQVLYLSGLIAELSGDNALAVESYARAREINPALVAATFRLAYYYDLHGEEAEAVKLYRECVSKSPVHANALMNLAVLYEDAGHYEPALRCVNRVLAVNPNHPRARLFHKDLKASRTMYYDEDQEQRIARHNAVLDIPVTDFELSVRARNCLKKMNIRTLGDLVRTTEPELLAYKNFGETSLKEIKDMLSSRGLRLGQAREDEPGLPIPEVMLKDESQGVLATRIESIEFSVRARRALESLNLVTMGDLVAKSEAELMGCKNFGQTSLNEIRQRLAEYGLQLRETT